MTQASGRAEGDKMAETEKARQALANAISEYAKLPISQLSTADLLRLAEATAWLTSTSQDHGGATDIHISA
jgi:hypothetical protein